MHLLFLAVGDGGGGGVCWWPMSFLHHFVARGAGFSLCAPTETLCGSKRERLLSIFWTAATHTHTHTQHNKAKSNSEDGRSSERLLLLHMGWTCSVYKSRWYRAKGECFSDVFSFLSSSLLACQTHGFSLALSSIIWLQHQVKGWGWKCIRHNKAKIPKLDDEAQASRFQWMSRTGGSITK